MTTTAQAHPAVLGALVRYHGRYTSEHWATFYIHAVTGARYTLIDREYPNVTVLRQVSRTSITPTGEVIPLCGDCHHEATASWRGWNLNRCEVCGCLDRSHKAEEATR